MDSNADDVKTDGVQQQPQYTRHQFGGKEPRLCPRPVAPIPRHLQTESARVRTAAKKIRLGMSSSIENFKDVCLDDLGDMMEDEDYIEITRSVMQAIADKLTPCHWKEPTFVKIIQRLIRNFDDCFQESPQREFREVVVRHTLMYANNLPLQAVCFTLPAGLVGSLEYDMCGDLLDITGTVMEHILRGSGESENDCSDPGFATTAALERALSERMKPTAVAR